MLRQNIAKVCQQRLFKKSVAFRSNNADNFNQELLIKLQSSFKKLVAEESQNHKLYEKEASKNDYFENIEAQNRFTNTVTKVYEDPALKSLNLDDIINEVNKYEDNGLHKFDEVIRNNIKTFNESNEENSLISILKKQLNMEKYDESTEPVDEVKELTDLPFNNSLFDLTLDEQKVVSNNTFMDKLNSFSLKNLTYNDKLMNNLKFKGVLKQYLVNKFLNYKYIELGKYTRTIIKELRKSNKQLVFPFKKTKKKLVEDFVDVILDGSKIPPSHCNYLSLFIRKDLYALMLSDEEISKHVNIYNTKEIVDGSVAFMKTVPNLDNWMELIFIYDSQLTTTYLINKIKNYKNTLIYKLIDNDLLMKELTKAVKSNIYLLNELKRRNQEFVIPKLFEEFKDYLKNGKYCGVTILRDDKNREVLVYTDSALKESSWVQNFITYKLDELTLSSQGISGRDFRIKFKELVDVKDNNKSYYLVRNSIEPIKETDIMLKYNQQQIFHSYDCIDEEVTLHNLLAPELENITMEKKKALHYLDTNGESRVKIALDPESENFITQKTIIPGLILQNEKNGNAFFTGRYKHIPFLKYAIKKQAAITQQNTEFRAMRKYMNSDVDTCIMSYYPLATSQNLVTIDHGIMINISEISLPPLDLLINLKRIECGVKTSRNLFACDSNETTAMLMVNQKTDIFQTTSLGYDVKVAQEFVYVLDKESVEINGKPEFLYYSGMIEECKVPTEKDMMEIIDHVRDPEFVNEYKTRLLSEREKEGVDILEEKDEVEKEKEMITVNLPVKVKIDGEWVDDRIMIPYKMRNLKVHSCSPAVNMKHIKIDRNFLTYTKESANKNEKYLSYQFEDSEELKELDAYFKELK